MSINLDALKDLKAPVVKAETALGIHQARITAYTIVKTEGKPDNLIIDWTFQVGKFSFTEKQTIYAVGSILKRKSDGVEFAPVSAFILPIRAHMNVPMDKVVDLPMAVDYASKHDITCRAYVNEGGYHTFKAVHPIIEEEKQTVDAAKAAIATLFPSEE